MRRGRRTLLCLIVVGAWTLIGGLIGVKDLDPCPRYSPHLLGVLLDPTEFPFLPRINNHAPELGDIGLGGIFSPKDCLARQKVAIIIPYRDRHEHLMALLTHLHPILKRQQRYYQIFVVEQSADTDFNRGSLMNIGFKEALKEDDFDCFIYHDVDLLPMDDRIMYECKRDAAHHLSVAIDKHHYRIIYNSNFGGVTALTRFQFEDANGFSNKFYGWGGEDDDLYHRIVVKKGYSVKRPSANFARFKMLTHDQAEANKDKDVILEETKESNEDEDGLTSLDYQVVASEKLPLYTWLLVKLPPAPPKRPPVTQSPFSNLLNGLAGQLTQGLLQELLPKPEQSSSEEEIEYQVY